MSGKKIGHVAPSPRRQVQRLLGPLAPLVAQAKVKCAPLSDTSSTNAIVNLRTSLADIRKQLGEFKKDASRRQMLDSAYDADQVLAKADAQIANLPASARFDAVGAAISAAVYSGDLSAAYSVQSQAMELVQLAEGAAATQREVSAAVAGLRKLFSPSGLVGRVTLVTASSTGNVSKVASNWRQEQSQALQQSIKEEGHGATQMSEEDKVLGRFDKSEHDKLLAQATAQADALLMGKALENIQKARALRTEAAVAAARVRELIRERQLTAVHLAKKLTALNYDEPDIYLEGDADQGDAAPLVIYCNNPSGVAHVRVTITIDGKLSIDIENVGEGEEETCVALLKGFQESLGAIEQDFKIDDYGRAAAKQLESAPEKVREKQREREGKA